MRTRVFKILPMTLNAALMASVLLGASMFVLANSAKADENEYRPGSREGMMTGQGYMSRPGYTMRPGNMTPGYMMNDHPMMGGDYMGMMGTHMGANMGSGAYGHMNAMAFLGAGPGALDLDEAQARTIVAAKLALSGNARLTVGDVSSGDDDTVLVEIVTKKENALVSRVTVDRKTGAIRPAS